MQSGGLQSCSQVLTYPCWSEKGSITVGIGCRKGVGQEEVTGAVRAALAENGIAETDVFMYATTVKKDAGTRD